MAGDPFKKVRPGEPLRPGARAWNTFCDMAADWQARQQARGHQPAPSATCADLVLVKNNSGADRERFHVLGIDGPIFTPAEGLDSFKNDRAYKGITPATASHLGKFVILLEPIKSGKIGWAAAGGVHPVHVNVTDELHEYADAADGQAGYLASGYIGTARILWKESGTGTKWALVRLADDRPVVETMWAWVIDGTWTGIGKPKMYATHSSGGKDYGLGWYVDETSYPDLGIFHPSRTRDSGNNWIETVVHNRAGHGGIWYPWDPGSMPGAGFWPIPVGSLIRAYRVAPTGWHWFAWEPPIAVYALAKDITAAGVVTRAEWYGSGSLEISVAVDTVRVLTNPPSDYVWYPHPQADDRILLVPHFEDINPSFLIPLRWYDTTPRIPLKSGAIAGPELRVDVSGGSGKPWNIDTDT